ncbi:NAD-dependent epimerase/dehydratase family protein [Tardisphaera miroshnichenkoae]
MRVAMIGGSGFIGQHTAKFIGDYDICVYDLVPPKFESEYVQGNVLDEKRLETCVDGSDAVIFLASLISVPRSFEAVAEYLNVNACGAASLMEAMRNASKRPKKVIVSSSAAVYGEGAYACDVHGKVYPPPRTQDQLNKGLWEPRCPYCGRELRPLPQAEGDELRPLSPYALTKQVQEWLITAMAPRLGYTAIVLRYFNVYGPGQRPDSPYSGVITKFISQAMQGKRLQAFEDGLQTRDYVYADDVGKANARALELEESATINVGTGTRTTVLELAKLIAGRHGVDVEVGGYRQGDIRHSAASVDAMRTRLGWQPRTALEDGIGATENWMKESSRLRSEINP